MRIRGRKGVIRQQGCVVATLWNWILDDRGGAATVTLNCYLDSESSDPLVRWGTQIVQVTLYQSDDAAPILDGDFYIGISLTVHTDQIIASIDLTPVKPGTLRLYAPSLYAPKRWLIVSRDKASMRKVEQVPTAFRSRVEAKAVFDMILSFIRQACRQGGVECKITDPGEQDVLIEIDGGEPWFLRLETEDDQDGDAQSDAGGDT
jgi:hypothetical protein